MPSNSRDYTRRESRYDLHGDYAEPYIHGTIDHHKIGSKFFQEVLANMIRASDEMGWERFVPILNHVSKASVLAVIAPIVLNGIGVADPSRWTEGQIVDQFLARLGWFLENNKELAEGLLKRRLEQSLTISVVTALKAYKPDRYSVKNPHREGDRNIFGAQWRPTVQNVPEETDDEKDADDRADSPPSPFDGPSGETFMTVAQAFAGPYPSTMNIPNQQAGHTNAPVESSSRRGSVATGKGKARMFEPQGFDNMAPADSPTTRGRRASVANDNTPMFQPQESPMMPAQFTSAGSSTTFQRRSSHAGNALNIPAPQLVDVSGHSHFAQTLPTAYPPPNPFAQFHTASAVGSSSAAATYDAQNMFNPNFVNVGYQSGVPASQVASGSGSSNAPAANDFDQLPFNFANYSPNNEQAAHYQGGVQGGEMHVQMQNGAQAEGSRVHSPFSAQIKQEEPDWKAALQQGINGLTAALNSAHISGPVAPSFWNHLN